MGTYFGQGHNHLGLSSCYLLRWSKCPPIHHSPHYSLQPDPRLPPSRYLICLAFLQTFASRILTLEESHLLQRPLNYNTSYTFASFPELENRLVHLKTKQERTTMLLRPFPSFQLEGKFILPPPLSFFKQACGLSLLSFQLFSSLHPLHLLELFTSNPGVQFPQLPASSLSLKTNTLALFVFRVLLLITTGKQTGNNNKEEMTTFKKPLWFLPSQSLIPLMRRHLEVPYFYSLLLILIADGLCIKGPKDCTISKWC